MRIICSTAINEKYEECRLRKHDKKDSSVSVPGFMGTTHLFRNPKLEQSLLFVIEALKQLPKHLRRSAGCEGEPWFTARHVTSQEMPYELEVVDKLLSMAAGLGLVSVTHPEWLSADTAFIIIEDLTAIRTCKVRKEYRHHKWEE